MENGPFNHLFIVDLPICSYYIHLKTVIFHSCVSLPEGIAQEKNNMIEK